MRNNYNLFIYIFLFFLFYSCASDEGEGGSATIKGKVIVVEYDENFCVPGRTYDAIEENVYLIYGDDDNYGDDVKTHFNGNYEFNFLRKGNYLVYAYSKCIECPDTCQVPVVPVIIPVEITSNGQVVNVQDIIIKDNF